ncbi:hypothetical protein PF004_g26002 [Phytophthora fragariae]|uniref:Uncharacterized protein n=1 Tax=Phytophthora fragariae TaxID=53985 RepID=A0A6G0MPP0_9STRA|nr:hypothetical protein PF004_g26002 [Phytophthora fragariae]
MFVQLLLTHAASDSSFGAPWAVLACPMSGIPCSGYLRLRVRDVWASMRNRRPLVRDLRPAPVWNAPSNFLSLEQSITCDFTARFHFTMRNGD